MFKNKWMLIIFCIINTMLLTACGKEVEKDSVKSLDYLYVDALKDENKQEYKTDVVKIDDFVVDVIANGTIKYLDEVALKMDATNAVFDEFKIEIGDKVKKGDVIATFYIEEDEEYLEDLKARVKKAESEFSTEVKSKKVAIAELEHNLSILPEGSDKEIMKARLEKAKMDYTEYLKTEASIKEMKTTLSDYQKEIKRTKVYAEHAGLRKVSC